MTLRIFASGTAQLLATRALEDTSQFRTSSAPQVGPPDFAQTNVVTQQFVAAQNTHSNATQTGGDEQSPIFVTIDGEWRRDANNNVAFYRNGEKPAGTEKFDREYYRPDSKTYLRAENEWVHLNARGALRDLSQYKDQPRPANVSAFDWQGYEWVSAANVPGEYTADAKVISFNNPDNAKNQDTILRRYIQQNIIGTDEWMGDVDTDEKTVARARELGVTIKTEETGKGENGATLYKVEISDEDLAKLRQVKAEWQTERTRIAAGVEQGRRETNQMFADQGRVLWNSAVNIAEGTINTAVDVLASQGGTRPVIPAPYDPLHVDFSGAKLRYESQMMRRNLEGKLDGDGIKAGEAIETGVTLGAPLAIGAAITPEAATQTLDSLGALPKIGPLEGKVNFQINDPGITGKTIVDVDKFEGKILWEEKSATSGVNKFTGVDETTAKWIPKHITKKFEDLVEARKHLPPFYRDAEIGFDFVKPGADPSFKTAVEAEIKRLTQQHPEIKIHVRWR